MIKLLAGDCRDVLPTLPAESVQCVVTSPPYLGLRDYGTARWDGGAPDCDHTAKQPKRGKPEYTNGQGGSFSSNLQAWGDRDVSTVYRDRCGRCGAVRVDRQIGLEASPDEYIATMVQVFREVRRVLRRDGTCWVNMGDSYAGGASHAHEGMAAFGARHGSGGGHKVSGIEKPDRAPGLAPKQLLLMPARLALALQADGWWVRSDVIWSKPNPMPESCRDRPTSAHEHVFLLTRSARYYYDADAVREGALSYDRQNGYSDYDKYNTERAMAGCKIEAPSPNYRRATRNARSVWTIATYAYPEAHFASFPPELAERCIKAGTSERGCCAACGKPWVRVTDTSYTDAGNGNSNRVRKGGGEYDPAVSARYEVRKLKDVATTGWLPGCRCKVLAGDARATRGEVGTVPCTVLDPFIGAGTTALVSDRLQRDCIGIDLNTQYTRMAMDRCIADAPLFTSFAPAEDPEEARMADLFAGDEYERPMPSPKPMQVPRGWDTGPGAHGTIHRTGRTLPDMAAD